MIYREPRHVFCSVLMLNVLIFSTPFRLLRPHNYGGHIIYYSHGQFWEWKGVLLIITRWDCLRQIGSYGLTIMLTKRTGAHFRLFHCCANFPSIRFLKRIRKGFYVWRSRWVEQMEKAENKTGRRVSTELDIYLLGVGIVLLPPTSTYFWTAQNLDHQGKMDKI